MKTKLLAPLGIILILVALAAYQPRSLNKSPETTDATNEFPPETQSPETLGGEKENLTLVTRIIDGDTIELEGGQRVRYIGVDTPEPGECLGREAAETNSKLLGDGKVRLETDIEKYDRYGRLLAYVWIGDSLVNEELLRAGVATVTTYAPNVKYVDRFIETQKGAKEASLGLWSGKNCPATSSTTSGESQIHGAQQGCAIKGNISSSGEKIYHVPGQRYYERTKIDEGKGERWFCTEEEAVGAGWRKAKI